MTRLAALSSALILVAPGCVPAPRDVSSSSPMPPAGDDGFGAGGPRPLDVPARAAFPTPTPSSWCVGVASFYGEAHRGLPTANGEAFDPDGLTAAAWDVPFGTVLEVSHAGRSVRVRVNDRGPARRLRRCVDLARAAFQQLAPLDVGLIDVTVAVVP